MNSVTRSPHENLVFHAISMTNAERYRTTRRDDLGNELAVRTFAGGESAPCRVCLRIAEPGDDIILLALCPFRTRGPYAEIGPIFIHAEACGTAEAGFPEAFRTRALTLRGYDAFGEIARAILAPPGEAEAWIARTLEDPAIDVVHVRSPSYGCYDFAVTRAGETRAAPPQ